MKGTVSACALAIVILTLGQSGSTEKPEIRVLAIWPIQEGENFSIRCRSRGRVNFSRQKLTGKATQSLYRRSFSRSFSRSFFGERTTHIFDNATAADTGWYACAEKGVEIQNDEQMTKHSDANISWTYVYVNSANPFAVMDANEIIPVVAGRSVVIPCRPTSPDSKVKLEISQPQNRSPPKNKYDPEIGFIIEQVDPIYHRNQFQCKIDGTEGGIWPEYALNVTAPELPGKPKITQGTLFHTILGENLVLDCQADAPKGDDITLYWKTPDGSTATLQGRIANETDHKDVSDRKGPRTMWISKLTVRKTERSDRGEYICVAKGFVNASASSVEIQIWEPGNMTGGNETRVNLSQPAVLSCSVNGYSLSNFTWVDINTFGSGERSNTTESHSVLSTASEVMYLNFTSVTREDNGTYECRAMDYNGSLSDRTSLIVTEVPEVTIDLATSEGNDTVYLHWTVYDGNDPVRVYHIQQRKLGAEQWENCSGKINETLGSYVAEKLEANTSYDFRVTAENAIGSNTSYSKSVKTLEKDFDTEFISEVTIQRLSDTKVKVFWTPPEEVVRDRFHYYELLAKCGNDLRNATNLLLNVTTYIFHDLRSGQEYIIEVQACNMYTGKCVTSSSPNTGGVSEGVAYSGFAIAFLTFPIVAIFLCIWKRRDVASRKRFMEANFVRFRTGALRSLDSKRNMADQAELLPYDDKWEYPKEQLKLGKVIGSGAFGIVKRGRAISILKKNLVTTVAVKMLRPTFNLDHMTALSRELKILAHLGKHLNVVNLLGACTTRMSYGELLVIVEYCRFGNIRDYILSRRDDFLDQVDIPTGICNAASTSDPDYIVANDSGINTVSYHGDSTMSGSDDGTVSIVMSVDYDDADSPVVEPGQCAKYVGDFTDKDSKPINTRDLLSWGWQVARGMKYLSSKRVVHGDLAARNILLADCNVVKICDFGLAKSLYESDTYQKEGRGPLPIKWMAIESIRDRVFSVKSDVWSFGVVVWEFFSLAQTPWPEIENENVYQKLINDFRMERPKYATEDMYTMMLNCWNAEPSLRPSFDELEESIEGLLDENVKSVYTKLDAPFAALNAKELAEGKTDYFTTEPSQSTPCLTESEKDQSEDQ